jgi:ribosomal 50S subunit-recycling heat shock protein
MTLASRRADGVASADMPVIKVNDKRYPLRPGANRLGAGADVDVRVDDDPAIGVQAIVDVESNEQAVIRPASDGAAILVNGVVLAEPTPLMHGDKLEIAGTTLSYSVEKKAGKTQHMPASQISSSTSRPTPARSTATSGGRIVSLVDGREYMIPSAGITIGRDAGSGIVVPEDEVSRHHAKVAPGRTGYTIRDFSANGVKVNGVRIKGSKLLSRSDIIKIGTEEFRFYADVEPPAAKASATPAQPTGKIVVNAKRSADSGAHAARVSSRGIPAWIWILLFVADAAALYFLLKR